MDEQLKAKLEEAGVLKDVQDFVRTEKDTSFNAGVGKAYEEVDKTTSEIFGAEKQEGQMTTMFLRNAAKMYQEGVSVDIDKKYKDIREENKSLKQKIEEQPDLSKYEDLRKTHNETLKKHEEEVAKLKQEFEFKEKQQSVQSVLSELPLEFPDDEFKSFKMQKFVEKLKEEGLLDNTVNVDGKLILKGGEKHGHKDFVLQDMAKKEFESYIKKEEGKAPSPGTPTPTSSKLASVKSKAEAIGIIRDGLVEQGLKVTDDAWDKEYMKALEENKDTLDSLE